MVGDDLFYVWHAAVTYFYRVSVYKFMKLVRFCKAFIDQFQKFFADV